MPLHCEIQVHKQKVPAKTKENKNPTLPNISPCRGTLAI